MKIYCEIDFHIFPIMKTIRDILGFVLRVLDDVYVNVECSCCFVSRVGMVLSVYYDKLCGRCEFIVIMLI